jgi:hypothetical protein
MDAWMLAVNRLAAAARAADLNALAAARNTPAPSSNPPRCSFDTENSAPEALPAPRIALLARRQVASLTANC